MREGPTAPASGGAVGETVPEGTDVRGDWDPAPSGRGAAAVAVLAGLAAAGALVLARRGT